MDGIQVRRMTGADEQAVGDKGRGIGTSLVTSFLDLVDEQRSPAYLETDRERNLPVYQRFGFVLVAEEDILGVKDWYMWREARAS